ncbi:MAG TPA: VOC family protein [Actinobacteria bacterium]|nr:VOC family protein [Actinomycetota bacterium]
MSIPAVRLNHAVLFVSDLEQSIGFWTSAFDMAVIAREPRANAAFLRLGEGSNHHDLGLFGIGPVSERPAGRSVGLYHLAWQVDTIEQLAQARSTLEDMGALTGVSSHGATKSLYGADPDGNEFEVMWMLPIDRWGEYDSTAPVDPLDLDAELEKWAGVSTGR